MYACVCNNKVLSVCVFLQAGGGLGCTSDCPGGKCPECEPAKTVLYQKKDYCGIISDQDGPFKYVIISSLM